MNSLSVKIKRSRMLVIILISFASGLPLMLSTQTLQLCFTSQGFDVKMMKWFAVIVLPYSLKFLWAPLFDRYSLAGGERRRVWIMFFQALMIVLILLMACLSQLHGVLSFGLQSVFSLKFNYQDAAISLQGKGTHAHPQEWNEIEKGWLL